VVAVHRLIVPSAWMLTSAAKAVLVAMIDVVRMMTTAAIVLLNLILIYAVFL